jgi:hypothetical protein
VTVTDADRRSALERAVTVELTRGGRLESQTNYNAVVLHGNKVNHILHLILSLLTAGLWLFVWLVLVLTNKQQRVVLSVDEAGGVLRTVTSG